MTIDEAKKMLEAKLECLKHETSGTDYACNQHLCEDCSLNYEQGNVGEQKEALDMAIKALEQQPKRGKWIKAIGEENLALWMCDQCGCKIYSETEHDRKKFHAWCGECGARMDADMREVQDGKTTDSN